MKQIMTILILVLLFTVGSFAQSKSLDFDGIDDDVTVVDSDSYGLSDATDSWTMEAWVLFDQVTDEKMVFRFWESSGNGQLYVTNGKLKVTADVGYVAGTTIISTGRWYHIAWVRTPTDTKLYLDGDLEISAAATNMNGAGPTLRLGSYNTSNGYRHDGKIDEFRLWSVARTQVEIKESKDQELLGSESNLLIYYDFNDESGSTVTDRANNYNGTLNNSPTWSTDSPMDREYLPEGGELLSNNYFNEGLENWHTYVSSSCTVSSELDTMGQVEGKRSWHIKITKLSSGARTDGQIQFYQDLAVPNGIKEGKKYHIQYRIKSSKAISNLFTKIHMAHDPFDEIVATDGYKAVSLPTNKVVTIRDTVGFSLTDDTVKLSFNLGAISEEGVDIWIDAIHFIELPKVYEKIEENLPKGKELLLNSYFADGLDKWDVYLKDRKTAEVDVDTTGMLEDANSAHVTTKKVYTDGSWKIQFRQQDIAKGLQEGKKYHIQFMIKSNKAVSGLNYVVQQQHSPWDAIYSKEISLPANEVVTVVDTFYSSVTDSEILWSFDLGLLSEANVDIWFDAVHLIELRDEFVNIFPPISRWRTTIPDPLPRPEYLETVHDPKYGVDITRISDPDVFGVSKADFYKMWNHYPKDQAWNADMSLISLNNGFFLLDGEDYTIYKKFGFRLSESRWSNVDPEIKYFCSGSMLKKLNIETEKVTTLHNFPGYNVTIGPWEGNISADDKYVVITHESGGSARKAVLYDIELDTVLSTMDIPGYGANWVSITPSGNYIVLQNNNTDKTEVYDLDFNFLRNVGFGTQHGDFGVDVDGNEVWVQVIPIGMARLNDGKFTRLLQAGSGGHISGRGFQNPGWALYVAGIYGNKGSTSATEMVQVKLDDSGIIRHFGHSRSSFVIRNSSSMATVRQDGKRIIFNSDWNIFDSGDVKDEILSYIVEYRQITDVKDIDGHSVDEMKFKLSQNYPNPFNPTTTIDFTLTKEGMTKLVVYNILGQEVKVLLNENMQAGLYSVPFSGSNLSSGVYFYKLQSNNQVEVKKMLLLK